MRKALLAVLALSIVASLAPANAASISIPRTIVAPTAFGGEDGVISLPSITNNPTNPAAWRKMNVVTRGARCAYEKGGANAQNATTGQLGYVLALPSAFSTGDSFKLEADPANANFDFDVYFVTTLGACLQDVTVTQPACTGEIPVTLEGDPPSPRAQEYQTTSSSCGESTVYPRSIFTAIGNEPTTTLTYNANFAIVVMPVGANGKFILTLNGV